MSQHATIVNVLIADDDEGMLLRLGKLLADIDGVRVVATAGNGAEAIDRLACCQVDVAVVDYQMPGRNGLDVLAHIRSRNLPMDVVILSAYDSEEFQRHCLARGASLFVSKAKIDALQDYLAALASARSASRDD